MRTDPETGRRSLYLNANRMEAIVGHLSDTASDRLLDRLIEHARQERSVHRHVWRPHDVVIWDNGRSMHRATADYGDAEREMHRILLRRRPCPPNRAPGFGSQPGGVGSWTRRRCAAAASLTMCATRTRSRA